MRYAQKLQCIPVFAIEHSVRNSFAQRLPPRSRAAISCGLRPGGHDRDVLFQVVEDQRSNLVPPLLVCRDCIQRQLQALVRGFLVAGFAGLVVDDRDAAVRPPIDAVDAPDDHRLTNLDLE